MRLLIQTGYLDQCCETGIFHLMHHLQAKTHNNAVFILQADHITNGSNCRKWKKLEILFLR